MRESVNKFKTSENSESKCHCGQPYKGYDCSCGRGIPLKLHKAHIERIENEDPVFTRHAQSKGLIALNIEAFVTKDPKWLGRSWHMASKEEQEEAKEFWRNGFKPNDKRMVG